MLLDLVFASEASHVYPKEFFTLRDRDDKNGRPKIHFSKLKSYKGPNRISKGFLLCMCAKT